MSPQAAEGRRFRRAPQPTTAMMYKFLAPVLSAQLRIAPTGSPRDIRNLFPAAPPLPLLDAIFGNLREREKCDQDTFLETTSMQNKRGEGTHLDGWTNVKRIARRLKAMSLWAGPNKGVAEMRAARFTFPIRFRHRALVCCCVSHQSTVVIVVEISYLSNLTAATSGTW